MKSLFIAFLTFFALISCRSDDELDIKTLVGDWEWISSSGGITGQTETPTTTGKTITIRFTEDNKYAIITNGAVTNEGTFSLYKGVSDLSHYEVTFIHFSNSTDVIINKNEDGVLILNDDLNDGYTSTYYKK